MVGCPVNCSFCATGKLGFGGNLTAKEIVDQVMYFQRLLQPEDKTVTNIVFMGMGEPLLNLDAVLPAISLLTSPETLGLSPRRLTVSTSGYLPQFDQLTQSGFRGRLAISLHAPNQELRASLMPVAKVYPLD
jgi:23S rRNA (adenine2503-C2)-methyltransferase